MRIVPVAVAKHLLLMGVAAVVLAGADQTRVALAAEEAEGKVVFADLEVPLRGQALLIANHVPVGMAAPHGPIAGARRDR